MSAEPSPRDDEHDRRLGEAIDGYLEQLDRGKTISVEEWVERFPDVGDDLRECLEALRLVERAAQRPAAARSGAWGSPGGASGSSAAAPEAVGEAAGPPTLPGYTLLEEIGRGGMGLVYRALQHATRRVVALKVLAGGSHASPTARRRFEREVELAAGLDHSGIVRVLEAGESAGGVYCAMEFVDGRPLHVHLDRQRLSVQAKLRLFLQIIEAVQYAHLRAVIHRDLKPSNIMVDREGHARILDFGLARFAPEREPPDKAGGVTQDGQLVGTLPYFSPEQAAGTTGELDMRSDLYALGVILYETLTGRLPYETGGPLADALHNICHTIPPRPSQFCRELNADIDAVVLKALEKSKEDRYQTAAELAKDIRCCLRGEPAEANRSSRFYLLRKAYARHRTQVRLAAAGLSLVLVASVVILTLYVQVQRERDRLEEQLHLSTLRRGLAHLAAGHDSLAGSLLWSAYLERPDPHAYWSLLSYYAQNPLFMQSGGGGWVTSLAFSPDHRFLAYATLDGSLGIRDAASLEVVWSTEAHPGGASCLDFSPAGDLLASGGADGLIKLWNVEARELLRELDAHPGGVTQVRFARGPDRLMSAGDDGRVLLWGLGDKDPPDILFADEDQQPIVASDLSGSGKLVAAATSADVLWIMETESGECLAEARRFTQPIEAVRFNPDERTLAVWSNAEVSLWDVATGTQRWVRDAGLSEPRPTSLWDLSPQPHVSWTPALEFSSDGALLVSAGWDAVVRIWQPGNGDGLGELRAHGTAVYALAFQPESHRLAASFIASIAIWDLDHHPATLSRRVSPGLERTCVAVSGRATLMAWADAPDGAAGVVSVMQMTPPRDVSTWQAHATPVEALALDPDGRRLATADCNGNVRVWDIARRERLSAWRTGTAGVRALAFSPDGTHIASGNVDGELHVWNPADGCLEQSWAAHEGLVLATTFAPDGERLVSAGTDWLAKLWQLGQPEPLSERQHDEWVNAVAFSPDGERLATGSADLTIRIGRPGAAPQVKVRNAHAHWVNGVAFLDQGRVLVSGGNDAAIRFWEASSGEELAMLPSLWGPIHSLAATQDGRFLAIGAAEAAQLIDLAAAAELIHRETLRRR